MVVERCRFGQFSARDKIDFFLFLSSALQLPSNCQFVKGGRSKFTHDFPQCVLSFSAIACNISQSIDKLNRHSFTNGVEFLVIRPFKIV